MFVAEYHPAGYNPIEGACAFHALPASIPIQMPAIKGFSFVLFRNISLAVLFVAIAVLAFDSLMGSNLGKTAVLSILAVCILALALAAFLAHKADLEERKPKSWSGKVDKRLSFILENSGCAAAICSDAGTILEANAEWHEHPLLGNSALLAAGHEEKLSSIFTGKSRLRIERAMADVSTKASHQRFVISQYLPPNHFTLGVLIDKAGDNGNLMLFRVQDESRYSDALGLLSEQSIALLDSETRFKLLVEQVWEAVVLVDADTLAIEECNPAFEILISKPSSKIVGKNILSFFPPESVENASELFFPAASGHTPGPIDLEITSDGSRKTFATCQTVGMALRHKT